MPESRDIFFSWGWKSFTLKGCDEANVRGGMAGAESGKRTILGNDSEDRDTIIVQVEPTGPGGFHDERRWMDPNTQSFMRNGVVCANGRGAEPAKP
jgi:hypothetical protein